MSFGKHVKPDLRPARLERQWRGISAVMAEPRRRRWRWLATIAVPVMAAAAALVLVPRWAGRRAVDGARPRVVSGRTGSPLTSPDRSERRTFAGSRELGPDSRAAIVAPEAPGDGDDAAAARAAGIAAACPPRSARVGQPAQPADALAESIGVNTFLHYTNTPYGDVPRVRARLAELGVRHIFVPALRPAVVEPIRALAAEPGVKAAVALSSQFRATLNPDECVGNPKCQDAVSLTRALGGALDALVLEGSESELEDAGWSARMGAGVTSFRRAMAADSPSGLTRASTAARTTVPIVGPAASQPSAAAALGSLLPQVDVAAWAWTFSPGPPARVLDRLAAGHGPLMGALAAKPKMLFGVFWRTGSGSADVSERVHGKYATRVLVDSFSRGFTRTYLHELLDAREDWVAGLLRTDLTAKPAFHAVRRLIKLTSDPGLAFATAPLAFRIEGASRELRSTLIERRDGAYLLLLWREVRSADADADETIDILFDTPLLSAEMSKPLDADDPLERVTRPTRLHVAVPDHILAVKLVPACR